MNSTGIYYRSTDAELRHFAKERKVSVKILAGGRKKPNRLVHIAALEQADKDRRFPFLDLSAELRNTVYKYLLHTGDLRSCDPTILKVCRQLHNEASDILYKAHCFEIGIHGDAVLSEGVKCGNYSPTESSYWGERPGRDITMLRWPSFIQSARIIRLKFVFPIRNCWRPFNKHAIEGDEFALERVYAESHGCPPGGFHSGFYSILNNVLYSVCSTLVASKHIRDFELDLSELNMGTHEATLLNASCDCLQRAVEPLTMLKGLERLAITGSWPGIISLMENAAKKVLTWRAESGSIIDRYRTALRKAEMMWRISCKEASMRGIPAFQEMHEPRCVGRVEKQCNTVRRLVCPSNTMFINTDWEGALIWEGDALVRLVQQINVDLMRVWFDEAREKVLKEFDDHQALLDRLKSL